MGSIVPTSHTLAGVPLVIKRVRGARNYTLSYNAGKGLARLSLPMRASQADGLAFAVRKEAWLAAAIARSPAPLVLAPNCRVDVLDESLLLTHREGRGTTAREGDALVIYGDAAFFERRVRDYLRKQLLAALDGYVEANCRALGVPLPSLSIKSMATRWGSCSSRGVLAFSFRLVFCPLHVVRYLAAHECAHLIHHNHSARFWALVGVLDPEYKTAHAWLKTRGHSTAF